MSLSREFVFDLGGILNNPQNQDLRDLVLTEGPNWFRYMPESHQEMPQILRFFGCKNYAELQTLGKQPTLIAPKLEELLSVKVREFRKRGRGKERGVKLKIRRVLSGNAEKLIALYKSKEASGFNPKENR